MTAHPEHPDRSDPGFVPTGDALIDDVRRIRWRISQQHGHNIDRLFKRLKDLEALERAKGRKFITTEELRRRPKAG